MDGLLHPFKIWMLLHGHALIWVNSLWPNDAIWRQRHQANTWTSVDFSLARFCSIRPRAISQRVSKLLFYVMRWRCILYYLLPLLPRINDSNNGSKGGTRKYINEKYGWCFSLLLVSFTIDCEYPVAICLYIAVLMLRAICIYYYLHYVDKL